jgi:F-type H+-transporting ATPase subunit b
MSLNDLLPNWTLIPQMLVFWTLLWVLSKYIFKPYGNLIELRIKETTGLQTESEKIMLEAVNLQNKYEEKVNTVRTELHKMLEGEKKKYQGEVDLIVAKAKNDATLDIQNTKELISKEVSRASNELSPQVESFSEEIVSKIIGRGITS